MAEIDLTPTEEMAANAARGLELRRKHGKGGTEIGVARARDISNRKNLSPETVRRMHAFFSRHEKNKAGGEDDAGYIAWLLWGGDSGQSWAKRKVEQMDKGENQRSETYKEIAQRLGSVAKMGVQYVAPRSPVSKPERKYRVRLESRDTGKTIDFRTMATSDADARYQADAAYGKKWEILAVIEEHARPGAKAKFAAERFGLLDRLGAGYSAMTASPVDPRSPEYKSALSAAKKSANQAVGNYKFMRDKVTERQQSMDKYVQSAIKAINSSSNVNDVQHFTEQLQIAVRAMTMILSSVKTPFARPGVKVTANRAEDVYRKLNTWVMPSNAAEIERLAAEAVRLPNFTPKGYTASLHQLAVEQKKAVKQFLPARTQADTKQAEAIYNKLNVLVTPLNADELARLATQALGMADFKPGGYAYSLHRLALQVQKDVIKAKASIKFKGGDVVVVPYQGKRVQGKIVGHDPVYGNYVVSIDGGKNIKVAEKDVRKASMSRPGAKAKFGVSMSKALKDEIAYHIENSGDIYSPVTVGDVLKEMMQDMNAKGHPASEFRKELQDIGIRLGVYKGYSKQQMADWQTNKGKAFSFNRGDTYYVFESWAPLAQVKSFSRLGAKAKFGMTNAGYKALVDAIRVYGDSAPAAVVAQAKQMKQEPTEFTDNEVMAVIAKMKQARASRPGTKAEMARDLKVRKGNFTDAVAIVGQNGGGSASFYAGLILRHKDGEEQVLWMKHGYSTEKAAERAALQRFDAHVSRMSHPGAKVANAVREGEKVSASDDAVSRKIRKLMDEGKPQKQAVAIALDLERRGEL